MKIFLRCDNCGELQYRPHRTKRCRTCGGEVYEVPTSELYRRVVPSLESTIKTSKGEQVGAVETREPKNPASPDKEFVVHQGVQKHE